MRKPKRAIGSWLNSNWGGDSRWDTTFVIACVVAVSLDPLFFYIPVIDRERKCLEADRQLMTVTLILRSLTDITFIGHIVYQIREAIIAAASDHFLKEKSGVWEEPRVFNTFFQHVGEVVDKLSWLSFTTDILALLPIPQVLIVVVFFKMRASGYLDHRKILNCFLLAQYLARIYRIHLSSRKFKKRHGMWIKGLFNIFLYILASHILGACWYFFSVQRETSCWYRSCGDKCKSTFYCDKHKNTEEMTAVIRLIDQACSIADDGAFDFGIFRDSLKNNNTISKSFSEKLCYSFWWGLRNLSNFGTNLETSNYIWENCFAIFVSIIGLLLFLYLIGNVQTFMSIDTERSEEIRRKIKSKEQDVKVWMERNHLPQSLRNEILRRIQVRLEENRDTDLENLFSILPAATKKSLKRFLCMSILRKVPRLGGMYPKVLTMICDYLKPVVYREQTYVAKIEEPVDRMLLITEGTLWFYSSISCSPSKIHRIVQNGDVYGDEQLLSWASSDMRHISFATLPISKENVKCHTKVEGFVITAKDLKVVASKCKMYWNYDDPTEKEIVASNTIGKSFRQNRNNPNKPTRVKVAAPSTTLRTRTEYVQRKPSASLPR